MHNFDFSPLYRTTIGFDHLSSLLKTVSRSDANSNSYPPYNIELLNKDQYRITMAVAGFVKNELDIQIEQQLLVVKGTRHNGEGLKINYLHQGIAARNFERRFQIADHVEVTQAHLQNGLLHIDLAREMPEAMKPKSIPIESNSNKLIDVEETEPIEKRDAA